MNENKFAFALIAALAASLGSAAHADTIVAPGESKDSVNKSLRVEAGTAVKDVDTVNGSIDIEDRASAGEVETVNGSIDLGDGVSVISIEAVNGNIDGGRETKVRDSVETVNGSIELRAGSGVDGSVTTVNGSIDLQQTTVAKNVETVNGVLDLRATRIGGNVELVNGRAEVIDASTVSGDIVVHKSKNTGWNWGSKPKPPVVIVGEGSEVRGKIIAENPDTKVYLHETARVGGVEGVSATRYAGASPE